MTESPSSKHNLALAMAFIAKAGVHSRFPRVSEQAECLPVDGTLPAYAYNPSILRISETAMLMTYRYHFAGDYRTKLGAANIFNGKFINAHDLPLEAHSLEDARLFSFHGEVWLSWVESNFLGQADPKSVVKYAQLESGGVINRIYQPAAGGNDGSSMQKNWCPFESDENLFFIFESWPNHVVFQVQGEKVINEYRTPAVRWPYGFIRGGSVVPHDGKLLRFFHSSTERGLGRPEKRYFVGCCLMESKPPFKVLKVSRKPILYGSEVDSLKPADRKACKHWKANIVFPCGATTDGDGWILAVGVNDAACSLVKIKPENLNL